MKCGKLFARVLLLVAFLLPGTHVCAEGERIVDSGYPDLAIIRVEPGDIFDPGTNRIQPTNAGKVFYQFFPDSYDFLVVWPFFSHERNYSWYTQAQNRIQGIGLYEKDISSWFGSDGRLLGVAFCQTSSNASLVLHEIGHNWSAYARFCEEDGSPSDALFRLWQYAPNHWMMVNFGEYGIMGGLAWIDNGDGTYTAGPASAERRYLPISLYVMGLIPPEEIPDIPVLELDQAPGWWQPGDTILAHERLISIDRMICAEGERMPRAEDSQKHFRAAFVILVMDEELPALGGIESIRGQVPDEFARATGYRATIDTSLLGENRVFLPLVCNQ